MLYYGKDMDPQWALIRLMGCPDEEPHVCIYVTVCALCHEEVENIQVSRFYDKNPETDEAHCSLGQLVKISEQLNVCQEKIKDSLIVYQEMVENLENGTGKLNQLSESGKNVVQTFAKLQIDITDLFYKYANLIREIKPMKLSSQRELLLRHNIMKAKWNSYSANRSTFLFYKESLGKILPVDAFNKLQDYVDKQAINSTRITTRLLGLEVLHLTTKYSLDNSTALKISSLDEICLNELKEFILYLGDDWEEHSGRLDMLVKEMFGVKRMIVPSERRIQENGASYVQSFLLQRCCDILQQTHQQIIAKSSETKFLKSKEMLKDLIQSTQTCAVR